MYMRVVFLFLASLLSILPTYASSSDLREVVQEKVGNALIKYNFAHHKQSSVYPKCNTFTDAYIKVEMVVSKNMQTVSDFLIKTPETTSAFEDFLKETNKTHNLAGENYVPCAIKAKILWDFFKSIPTGQIPSVKAKTVNKIRRNFGDAKELMEVFETTLDEIGWCIHGLIPQTYPKETLLRATRILVALSEWRKDTCKTTKHTELNEFDKPEFIKDVLESIYKTGEVNLVQFVCPHTDFSLLYSSNPEEYFPVSAKNSLLCNQIPHLSNLIKRFLILTGVPIRVSLVIGDDDEDSYIWYGVKKPEGLDEERLDKRRAAYLVSIKEYAQEKLKYADGKILPVEIATYSIHKEKTKDCSREAYQKVFQEIYADYKEYFTENDQETELERMKQLAKPGGYYCDLFEPDLKSLPEIVRAKFAAYAVDGLIAKDCSPFSILLQTEFPQELRTKMMNVGISLLKEKSFSVIYLLDDKEKDKTFPSSCIPGNPLTLISRLPSTIMTQKDAA